MRTSRITRVRSCRALSDRRERLLTVLGEVDLIPLELERATERLANGALVVDDEDAHCAALCARVPPESRGLSDFLAPAYPPLSRNSSAMSPH